MIRSNEGCQSKFECLRIIPPGVEQCDIYSSYSFIQLCTRACVILHLHRYCCSEKLATIKAAAYTVVWRSFRRHLYRSTCIRLGSRIVESRLQIKVCRQPNWVICNSIDCAASFTLSQSNYLSNELWINLWSSAAAPLNREHRLKSRESQNEFLSEVVNVVIFKNFVRIQFVSRWEITFQLGETANYIGHCLETHTLRHGATW